MPTLSLDRPKYLTRWGYLKTERASWFAHWQEISTRLLPRMLEALAARLSSNPLTAQRPSLTGADIRDEVRQVLHERLPLYHATAHHHLDASQPPRCTRRACQSSKRSGDRLRPVGLLGLTTTSTSSLSR